MPKKADSNGTKPEKEAKGPEPHEINSALSSDRMKALLEDHRRMGSRK